MAKFSLFRPALYGVVFCCSLSLSRAQDYTAYHRNILHAEEALSQGEIKTSLQAYNAAFAGYPHVFARDAYHACQLAALENHPDFKRFYLRCAQSGVPKSLLLKNRIIKSETIKDSTGYNSIYKEGRVVYRRRIDTTLRDEFINRYKLEQDNKGRSNYREICSDNFNRILILSQQGRYPGEDLIGPDEEWSAYYVLATLLHHPYSYVVLRDHLLKGLVEGKVQPHVLLYLYGFNQTRASVLYTPQIPVDTVHFTECFNTPFGRQSADTAAVNRARAAMYYPSLQIMQNLRIVVRKYGMDYKDL